MISRRSLLIGFTGLLTTSFVAETKTHLIKTDRPMLLQPPQTRNRVPGQELCGGRKK